MAKPDTEAVELRAIIPDGSETLSGFFEPIMIHSVNEGREIQVTAIHLSAQRRTVRAPVSHLFRY